MKKLFISLILGLFLTANSAVAAAPQVLGEYGDWIAYYSQTPQGIVCYMASTPKKDEGKYTKRGDIYTVITHRPKEKSFDVVNVNAGYTYKADSKVIAKIGNKNYERFFTNGDQAWAIDDKADRELVDAMKRGTRMIIVGTSSKGTQTKDTYSLSGFGKAYQAISAKCKKK